MSAPTLAPAETTAGHARPSRERPRWADLIRNARMAHGMSQRDAAACLDTSASLGSRVRIWKRWEQGRVRPSRYYARQIATLLDVDESDLLGRGNVDAVDRRLFLSGAALVGVAVLDGPATDDGVAGLERALDALRDIEESIGPGAAIRPAEALCDTADRLARSAVLAKRGAAVGWLAELLTYTGHLHRIVDERTSAQRFLDRAVTAGLESGDPLPLAHALGKSSVLARDRGDLGAAESLAVACIRTGGGPHPATSYTYVRAEIAARAGDSNGARQLLAQAERAVETLGEPLPTMPWSTPTYYAARTASVLRQLGDPAAPALLADALAAFPERWRRSVWARREFGTPEDFG